MIWIDMEKPSACRWTDEENNTHSCPFLDKEFDCLIQGHIGNWSWDEQYKDCPLHEVTAELMSNKPRYTEDEIKEICDKYMSSVNGYLGGVKDIVEASKDMPIRLRRPIAIVDTNDLINRKAAIDAIEEYADRLQIVDWKENPGVPYKAYALNWCINTIRDLPSTQPEPLTDKEQRIFLAAMGREEKVCKQVDDECRNCREPYEDSLVRTCHEITRKVKGTLWMT